jgi:hypothetical protein
VARSRRPPRARPSASTGAAGDPSVLRTHGPPAWRTTLLKLPQSAKRLGRHGPCILEAKGRAALSRWPHTATSGDRTQRLTPLHALAAGIRILGAGAHAPDTPSLAPRPVGVTLRWSGLQSVSHLSPLRRRHTHSLRYLSTCGGHASVAASFLTAHNSACSAVEQPDAPDGAFRRRPLVNGGSPGGASRSPSGERRRRR